MKKTYISIIRVKNNYEEKTLSEMLKIIKKSQLENWWRYIRRRYKGFREDLDRNRLKRGQKNRVLDVHSPH